MPRLVTAATLAFTLAGATRCAQSDGVMPGGPAVGSGGERTGTGGGSGGRGGSATGGSATGGSATGGAAVDGAGGASGGAGGRVNGGSGGSAGGGGGRGGIGSGGAAGGHVTGGSGGTTSSGGASGSAGTAGTAATFTQVYKMILNVPTTSPSNCAGSTCHIPGSSQAHVKFDTQANAYQTLRSVAIIPGNATGSILYTNLATGVMPDNRPMISDALLQLVESWIDAGALNN